MSGLDENITVVASPSKINKRKFHDESEQVSAASPAKQSLKVHKADHATNSVVRAPLGELSNQQLGCYLTMYKHELKYMLI